MGDQAPAVLIKWGSRPQVPPEITYVDRGMVMVSIAVKWIR